MKKNKSTSTLSADLQQKLNLYSNSTNKNIKISDYFSWMEFKKIFSNTTLIFPLSYGKTSFELLNFGDKFVVTIDYYGATKDLILNYQSAEDLLNNASIDGKPLKDIWKDLTIN